MTIKRYREADSSFKKNRHCEGKCIFENHLKKVETERNSNFQLHHRYFLSKVSCEHILYPLLFPGKKLFEDAASSSVLVYGLSSAGANQL